MFLFFTEPRGDSQLPGPSGLHINLPSSRDSDTEAAATTPTAVAAAANGKRIYLSFLVFSLSYNFHHTSNLEVFPISPQGCGKKVYLFTYFFKYIQSSFHAPLIQTNPPPLVAPPCVLALNMVTLLVTIVTVTKI